MTTGKKLGGPVANPIRQMLDGKADGVIFTCDDAKAAETTRYAALMLKRRNGYSYKTMRKDNQLTVYKPGSDPYELHGTITTRIFQKEPPMEWRNLK